jgi:GMP synthase (glutamine-hydrolysing)
VRVLFVHHERPLDGGSYDEVVATAGHEIVRWAPFEGESAPPLAEIDAAVILGGAVHPDADGTEPWLGAEVSVIQAALDRGLPTLGLCLGAQLVARASGAWVGRVERSEVGWYEIQPNDAGLADPVVGALGGSTHGFEWHHYTFELPDGAIELARSPRAIQAYRLGDAVWGLQFHPEVTRDQVYEWTGMAPDQVDGEPQAMLAETDRRIEKWTETGRRVCLAFLDRAKRAGRGRDESRPYTYS